MARNRCWPCFFLNARRRRDCDLYSCQRTNMVVEVRSVPKWARGVFSTLHGNCKGSKPLDTGIQDVDLLPDAAGGGLNVIQLDFGPRGVFGVHENSGRRGMGPQLTQQLQPLRLHPDKKRAHSGAARMRISIASAPQP